MKYRTYKSYRGNERYVDDWNLSRLERALCRLGIHRAELGFEWETPGEPRVRWEGCKCGRTIRLVTLIEYERFPFDRLVHA